MDTGDSHNKEKKDGTKIVNTFITFKKKKTHEEDYLRLVRQ